MNETKTRQSKSGAEILRPEYNENGSATGLTICGHEASHAIMRYHMGHLLPNITLSYSAEGDVIGGLCLGRAIDKTSDYLQMVAADYAWEWMEQGIDDVYDIYDQHEIIMIFDPVDGEYQSDCVIIEDHYDTHHDKMDDDTRKQMIGALYLSVGKTLQPYLPVINQIAQELLIMEELSAIDVYDLISKHHIEQD